MYLLFHKVLIFPTSNLRIVRDDRVLENVMGYETATTSSDYFETVQTEIKPHMRKIVCEWMLEICEEQGCQSEVFALAVDYLDRALSRVNVRKSQFQLLASVCIFVASKFKETAPMMADKLVVYSDFSITTSEITVSSLLILYMKTHVSFLNYFTEMGTAFT